jgi:Flp pilus assembly secretin CpaC
MLLRSFARVSRRGSAVLLSIAFVAAASGGANAAESVSVIVDQAKLMKLPERTFTVVVGNPLIADVTLQPGGLVVVTGKGYGSTNLVALDRGGNVLVDNIVQVEGPNEKLVTVYRGAKRETYSCMPDCQRRVTLGDGSEFFKTAIDQANTLNTNATVAPEKRLEREK